MDTKKDFTIAECGRMPVIDRKSVVVGAKQLRKALQNGRAVRVFLAENADPAVTAPIEELCKLKSVQISWVARMDELGSACGIEVGAAAAAIVR